MHRQNQEKERGSVIRNTDEKTVQLVRRTRPTWRNTRSVGYIFFIIEELDTKTEIQIWRITHHGSSNPFSLMFFFFYVVLSLLFFKTLYNNNLNSSLKSSYFVPQVMIIFPLVSCMIQVKNSKMNKIRLADSHPVSVREEESAREGP